MQSKGLTIGHMDTFKFSFLKKIKNYQDSQFRFRGLHLIPKSHKNMKVKTKCHWKQ